MNARQVLAVRVCGAATLVVSGLAIATFATRFVGLESFPIVRLSMGAAVLVAGSAFLLANVVNANVCKAICAAASALIALIGGFAICDLAGGRASFHLVDGCVALGIVTLLAPLCRSVWQEQRPIATS